MNEKYPYHPSEHYVFPSSQAEAIEDELHYYPEPNEYRRLSRDVLLDLYGKTPIMDTIKKIAFLRNSVLAASEFEVAQKQRFDIDFYLGSMMAVHTSVFNASRHKSRKILSINPMRDIDGSDEDREDIARVMKNQKDWEDFIFETRFEQQPVELQEAVMDMTDRLYHQRIHRQRSERSFMIGFLYANDLVEMYITPTL